MKVTLEIVIEGNVTLDASAEVETFGDLRKLAAALQTKVAGVKKFLPDMSGKKVERVRIAKE